MIHQNRWTKWKKPKQGESIKRIINGDPHTWIPANKRWSKDDAIPSGNGAMVPSQTPPSVPPQEGSMGPPPNRQPPPFPPTSINGAGGADDKSQMTDAPSQADIASFQLQLANMSNFMSKYG